MRVGRRARGLRGLGVAMSATAPALALAGCELAEVVIAEPEDVVVAEVLVQVRPDDFDGGPLVFALLHGTGDRGSGVPGARIVIHHEDHAVTLHESANLTDCLWSAPPGYASNCYRASFADERSFRPGDALRVDIDLPGGGRLEGVTRVPGDFRFTQFPAGQGGSKLCGLQPDTTLELRWTSSQGAWAYVGEAGINGLRAPMAARGIELSEDYHYLLGLAVSARDTTIVFPTEFGLLDRFGPDSELLVALQGGLPSNVRARVGVTAVDRNYVNWARGGNFNPSGLVRVPSLRGEGTGFFGAAVLRELTVLVQPNELGEAPPCR